MWMVLVGVLLLLLKAAGLTIVAGWSWWVVLSPFALAAAWWSFADASGLTRAREMRKEEERVADRRRRHLDAMGMTAQGRSTSARRPADPDSTLTGRRKD
jgi:small Trp-rich protein